MKILFLSADEDNGSVNELARRPVRAINASHAGTCLAEHILIPPNDSTALKSLLLDASTLAPFDAVVTVKPTRIVGLSLVDREFAAACRSVGALCVTIPVDPEPGVPDALSDGLADLVLCVSRRQYEAFLDQGIEASAKWIGHPVRECAIKGILHRLPVRRVLWENPVHCKPGFDADACHDMDLFAGELVRLLARNHIQLVPWISYGTTQDEWNTIVSSCDCGMECKSPSNLHSEFFRQKPATKVQNYMAGGLAVVCDGVEEYRVLAREGFSLAFADTPGEFAAEITGLYDNWESTFEASRANQSHVAGYAGIDIVTARILDAIGELVV